MSLLFNRITNVAKHFGQAAFFFPAANVANFSHGHSPVANMIAVSNLGLNSLSIATSAYIETLPSTTWVKRSYDAATKAISRTTPSDSVMKRALRVAAREVTDPNRVTAYSCLAISGLFMHNAWTGAHDVLLPAITSLFFGLGNLKLSSKAMGRVRDNPSTTPLARAAATPALDYGPGYAATGLTIGGKALMSNPLSHPVPLFLTSVGIAGTVGALGVIVLGNVKNAAVPFSIIASGGAVFALTGLVTGDYAGAATGALAAAGELSLAIHFQKEHNSAVARKLTPPSNSKTERFLTRPITKAMDAGWLSRYLPAPSAT